MGEGWRGRSGECRGRPGRFSLDEESRHEERFSRRCGPCAGRGTRDGCRLGVGGISDGPRAGDSGGASMNPESDGQLAGVEGVVKWFDPRKGFGFVVGPEGQDIFVHFSVIQGDGFRVLRDNSRVNYDAVRSDKGWKATRVSRVDPLEVPIPPRKGYTRSPRE